jgi:PAS domain S-box-containing protein
VPTSERRLELLPQETPGSTLKDRSSRRDAEDTRQAAFPASTAVRRLLVSVAAISVITAVLAFQALSTRLSGDRVVVAIAALVLVPVLWACSLGVHLSRRRSVLAYGRARQRLSVLSGNASDVLWEITPDGVVTYIAPHAEALLGFAPTALEGHRIEKLLAVHERARARELLAVSVASGRGWRDEQFTLVTRDGRLTDMAVSADAQLAANGRVVGFTGTLSDPESHSRPDREATLVKASVQAIIRDRKLHAMYQPIVSMSDDRVIGAEALTRFDVKPDAPPDVWFARAAEVGLGVDLEILALSTALESAHRLPEHIYLSINLSPNALADPRVTALLQHGGWPCNQLVIEVTEHVSVTDYASLASTVTTLRQLGVRIAVDDAGAGYASFRHILKLRPDYIKLDRALIDGIDGDAAKRALAGAFVAFGDELDVLIVAEGVETAAELSAARALGVHAAQGFHTGRPAPPGDAWGL